ncbi:MAG: histone deacetylase family protein, partial [Kiloniellales bacterium]|nr:histone deacetylase family protein [Kiloniellales bacterium]
VPERCDVLLEAARAAGHEVVAPDDHGRGPIAAIHTAEYLEFLEHVHERWRRIEGASEDVLPNIHPDSRGAGYPKSAVGQAGYHMADLACPIGAETWAAVTGSAQAAITAAHLVLAGERSSYALCRPPGHHAFKDLAGGFCYLNNTAIAAQVLRDAARRVAVLDVDLHHGNGTQGIFYERRDVLTVSIHADPARFYPFFWGHADERGAGPGLGANLNLPLPRGSGDSVFLEALDAALARIRAHAPDALVVALGLDASERDPFGGLAVTTEGFARIAEKIAGLGLPSLLVQEGGYLSDELGANLAAFLGATEAAQR